MTDQLLFTLLPKTGFYKSNNEMAYLDGAITAYYPHDVGDPDGYVCFTFYPDGDTASQHIRLWSTTTGRQKMRAEFDIETTAASDTNNFFFSIAQEGAGGYSLIQECTIVGAKRELLKVEFMTQSSGDALLKMYATKSFNDTTHFILRSIKVFQLP